MTVVPLGHQRMTKADIFAFMNHGSRLVETGQAGACVPVVADDGELFVALMDSDNEDLMFGFGKAEGWYYAFDARGQALARGQLIDEVLEILPA